MVDRYIHVLIILMNNVLVYSSISMWIMVDGCFD